MAPKKKYGGEESGEGRQGGEGEGEGEKHHDCGAYTQLVGVK